MYLPEPVNDGRWTAELIDEAPQASQNGHVSIGNVATHSQKEFAMSHVMILDAGVVTTGVGLSGRVDSAHADAEIVSKPRNYLNRAW